MPPPAAPPPFTPTPNLKPLTNKVLLITGGTAGLGASTLQNLALHNPAHIIFTGRNTPAATSLITSIHQTSPHVKLTFIPCDISSLASVQACATSILDLETRSKEGYEIQFATNYLGHALLVKLLLPLLLSTTQLPDSDGDVRVIQITSTAHAQAPSKTGTDFLTLKSPQQASSLGSLTLAGGKWTRYGQSKLAQLLYAEALTSHYPALTSVSIHPGVVYTGLFENVGFWTALPVRLGLAGKKAKLEEGHWNQCWAAAGAGKEELRRGEFYEPVGVVGGRRTKWAKDKGLAERLWRWTEEELKGWVLRGV